jgi:hypothetical protein
LSGAGPLGSHTGTETAANELIFDPKKKLFEPGLGWLGYGD